MRRHILRLGLLALSTLAIACATENDPQPPAAVRQALETIRAEALEAHMRVLADDELEGRATGSTSYVAAADYVADHFRELGLARSGGTEDYFQQVPLLRTDLVPEDAAVILHRQGDTRTLTLDTDVVLRGDYVREQAEIIAGVTFVGFGVTAPEYGHDDYAVADVRGKIVALVHGAPTDLPHHARIHYGRAELKQRVAAEYGAVGVVYLRLADDAQCNPWPRTVSDWRAGSMRWVDNAGNPQNPAAELYAVMELSADGTQALFSGGPRSTEQLEQELLAGHAEPFDLELQLEVRTASRQRSLESPNVVAMLPGSDPNSEDECVVIGAHLDHLGERDAVDGDAIYNGAVDNASGVAALLEIARAMTSLARAPRRCVVFLASTGAEMGLLGSDYFARHPPLESRRIVAQVNLDRMAMLHPLRDVAAVGVEDASLAASVEQAAGLLGLAVSPQPLPAELLCAHSDHSSFARQGIPAVWLLEGTETGSDVEGRQQARSWLGRVYHTPDDDMDQTFDFEAGAKFAQVSFLLSYLVADAEQPPH
jgi:hypothetical protein